MKYKFGDIAYNRTEKRLPKPEDKQWYIGLEHLEPGEIYVNKFGLDVDIKGEKLIMHKGDVLLGKRNAYLRRAAIAPHDGLFSAHGLVLNPNEAIIHKDFFPFFVASDKFFDEAIRISVGGLSPTINWSALKELEFNLPTLSKQKVLADKLWAAYEVKRSYQRMIDAINELVESHFIKMFNNTRTVTIGSMFATTSGGTPSSKNTEYYEGGSIPWLTSGEVAQGIINQTINYITELGLLNSSAKWVPINTVVIAMYGATVGKVGLLSIPCTTNQAICCILPKEGVNPMFLFYAIKNKESWMIEQAVGAAQPNISQTVIKKMEIPMPSLQLQDNFVDFAKKADKSKVELSKSIEAIDKIIKSLINENL